MNEKSEISLPAEKAQSALNALVSAVPYIGGTVGSLLSGASTQRKFERVLVFIQELQNSLEDIELDLPISYVKTDDFEDLFDEVSSRVYRERAEVKRRIYARFLAGALVDEKFQYDEGLRFLQIFEQIQIDHLSLLIALDASPRDTSGGFSGAAINTLKERLPDFSKEHISDLAKQTNALQITDLSSSYLNTMMTADGAQRLAGNITSFGRRFLAFLCESDLEIHNEEV